MAITLDDTKVARLKSGLQAGMKLLGEAKEKLRHDEDCNTLEGGECDCSVKEFGASLVDKYVELDELQTMLES
jgi:hypothetical protein